MSSRNESFKNTQCPSVVIAKPQRGCGDPVRLLEIYGDCHIVEAQVTILHFLQAENFTCNLASPLPTKAIRLCGGPNFALLAMTYLGRYPMFNTTLCYITRGDEVLMLHRVKKKNDCNQDKWIGIGGKFEGDETPNTPFSLVDNLSSLICGTICSISILSCGSEHCFFIR